ncbi:MAG: SMR family transporter [Candidatus Falkowbacteria bacterium]|nr:SMR family transporter [Candidatus Falkowbacteria bacterium]
MISWIIPLSLLIIFEIVADIFAKNWSLQRTTWIAVTSLASYLIANSFWLFALKNGSGLGRGAIIFSVATAIIAVILGILFYKEPVNKFQIIGLVLGVIAIVLLFWE